MSPVQQTLAVIRWVTAIAYFAGAMLLFLLASWLVWRLAHFWWPVDILAAFIAWWGVQCVRSGCEELAVNEAQRSQGRRPQ